MASNNIFERLSTQFYKNSMFAPDALTRYMGGHNRKNQPYVSGYWQMFIEVPQAIFPNEHDVIQQWIHATAEGFTPPSRNLNKADVPGQGGLGSSFITGQTLTRTFTTTFREYQNLPIYQIFQKWTSIFDPHIGVSPLSHLIPQSYKGAIYIIQTKPIGAVNSKFTEDMLEQVWFFHGVFPEGDGGDALASDIATNDVSQSSITFSFDGWPLTKDTPKVVRRALGHLNSVAGGYVRTYDNYVDNMGVGEDVAVL